jgi:fructose-1,6-bisphosphatase/sedoheptulose 1,7-bisphosphatase-like protein
VGEPIGRNLGGVPYLAWGTNRQSLVLRGGSGTVRFVESAYDLARLRRIFSVQY